MGGTGKAGKGKKSNDAQAPAEEDLDEIAVQKRRNKRGHGGAGGSSQAVLDEAANDAAAEASLMDEDAGSPKKQRTQGLQGALLDRRLDIANKERELLAKKVADLEKQLVEAKDAVPESPSTRTGTGTGTGKKVYHDFELKNIFMETEWSIHVSIRLQALPRLPSPVQGHQLPRQNIMDSTILLHNVPYAAYQLC